MTRVAQLLLIVAAAALWVASRLTWVSVRTFDGLGQPRTSTITGAAWSNALLPMAVLLLAAALAALAVRGWLLRVVAVLVAVLCVVLGYLGISLIVMPDVGPRGAELAGVPVMFLVGSERHLVGAAITLVAAIAALLASVLLMRTAANAAHDRYARTGAAGGDRDGTPSERSMWDALDDGRDPTDSAPGSEAESEGR